MGMYVTPKPRPHFQRKAGLDGYKIRYGSKKVSEKSSEIDGKLFESYSVALSGPGPFFHKVFSARKGVSHLSYKYLRMTIRQVVQRERINDGKLDGLRYSLWRYGELLGRWEHIGGKWRPPHKRPKDRREKKRGKGGLTCLYATIAGTMYHLWRAAKHVGHQPRQAFQPRQKNHTTQNSISARALRISNQQK